MDATAHMYWVLRAEDASVQSILIGVFAATVGASMANDPAAFERYVADTIDQYSPRWMPERGGLEGLKLRLVVPPRDGDLPGVYHDLASLTAEYDYHVAKHARAASVVVQRLGELTTGGDELTVIVGCVPPVSPDEVDFTC